MNNDDRSRTQTGTIKVIFNKLIDMTIRCIFGCDNTDIHCNLGFLEVPAGFSDRRRCNAPRNFQKLTWLPFIELLAIGAGLVVTLAFTAI